MAVERAHRAAVWPLEAAQWLAVRPSLSLLEPWGYGREGRAGVARRVRSLLGNIDFALICSLARVNRMTWLNVVVEYHVNCALDTHLISFSDESVVLPIASFPPLPD